MAIQFIADKVRVNGPKVDGGYTVTFEVGGYVWDQIKELPTINGETIVVGVITEPKNKEESKEIVVADIPIVDE